MPGTQQLACDVKDLELAAKGKIRIEWAGQWMPVLNLIRKRFAAERPLEGIRIAACLHVTTETANLAIALRDGGAQVVVCASNPLSTQDDVAASLVRDFQIPVFAIKGEDKDTYYSHISSALDHKPQITMDDGADLVTAILSKRQELVAGVIGGTEETTTGVIRLRSMANNGVLKYPIVAVNDADTKHLFDNRYGTGQSTIDGILRATNLLFAGSARSGLRVRLLRPRRLHARQGHGSPRRCHRDDPTRAIEAIMDGYAVMPMAEAAKWGDVFVTVTGNKSIIRGEHFRLMKDGAVVANSGHFNVELDLPALEAMSVSKRQTRDFVDEYTLPDKRKIYVLGEGRLINLVAAEGHPAVVMDMSFANQALCVEYLIKHAAQLSPKVYSVPAEIDKNVARLKLDSLGVTIDKLTPEQEEYLASWAEGT